MYIKEYCQEHKTQPTVWFLETLEGKLQISQLLTLNFFDLHFSRMGIRSYTTTEPLST